VQPKPVRSIYLAVLTAVVVMAAGCGSRNNATPNALAGPAASPAAQAPVNGAASTPSGATADAGAQTAGAAAPVASVASNTPSAATSGGLSTGGTKAAAGTSAAGSRVGSSPAQAASAGPSAGSVQGATSPGRSGQGTQSQEGTKAAPAPGTAPGDLPDAVRIAGSSSQGVTDTEIKVGILAPLSGYAGFLGELEVDAVKAYLSDVNANGGVRGRKYRIVTADTRFEPAVEASGARRMIDQEKVFALFTTWSDSIGPYVTSVGIPNFAFGVSPYSYSSKYPNIYPVGHNVLDSIVEMAYVQTQILKRPIKSVAILYETANLPWGDWVEYAKKGWEQFGVEVKSVDRFNIADGDCTQLVLKMQSLKIDFWQVGNSLGWPLCQQAMTRQGYTPPMGRGGSYTDDIAWGNQMGQGFEGVWAMTNGPQFGVGNPPLSPPANKGTPWPYNKEGYAPETDHFIQTMEKYSPRSAGSGGIESIWASNFWTQGKLLTEAVKRQVDAITWKGVNQWIQSQKNWSSGLVPPGSFDPKCKTGVTQLYVFQFHWNAQHNTVEEGDWHEVGGYHPMPASVKNAVVPGAGDCYMTAMADAKL